MQDEISRNPDESTVDRSPAPSDLARTASRRSFLGCGLAAATVPAALAVGASAAEGQVLSPRALQSARAARSARPSPAVPALQARAQNLGTIPTLYPGWNRRNFVEIRADENAHVDIIRAAIVGQGGVPRPKPTFQNLTPRNATGFAQLSATFENLGVMAYFGAAPSISSPAVFAVAASIAFVEAYHSGYLNTLINNPIVPNAATYVSPATMQEVVTAASPYIASLNDGGQFPAMFSPTPSPANDIAILNFALILEYLEAEYYNINVSRFFPGA